MTAAPAETARARIAAFDGHAERCPAADGGPSPAARRRAHGASRSWACRPRSRTGSTPTSIALARTAFAPPAGADRRSRARCLDRPRAVATPCAWSSSTALPRRAVATRRRRRRRGTPFPRRCAGARSRAARCRRAHRAPAARWSRSTPPSGRRCGHLARDGRPRTPSRGPAVPVAAAKAARSPTRNVVMPRRTPSARVIEEFATRRRRRARLHQRGDRDRARRRRPAAPLRAAAASRRRPHHATPRRVRQGARLRGLRARRSAARSRATKSTSPSPADGRARCSTPICARPPARRPHHRIEHAAPAAPPRSCSRACSTAGRGVFQGRILVAPAGRRRPTPTREPQPAAVGRRRDRHQAGARDLRRRRQVRPRRDRRRARRDALFYLRARGIDADDARAC